MLDNILSIMIFLPIVAGLVILSLPIGKEVARGLGIVISALIFLFGIKVFLAFQGSHGFEFRESARLISSIGFNYTLGVDGISILVLLAGICLFPLVFLLLETKSRGYYGNLLITQGAMIGAISSTNLILFYFFWEIMLLPIFFMIGLYGGPNKVFATLKITLYTIAGSLLMFFAVVYLGYEYYHQFGNWDFNIDKLSVVVLTGKTATWAFVFFMIAFAIKIPLFPFHTWLPDAYTEAPVAATFLLSAIMAKIGVYAVIRFVMPLFAEELGRYALILCYSGVIGMMYCGIAAIGQNDFKKMLAFSSASHMGIIALGIFCFNSQALTGTLYQIVAHATSTGVLFVLLGIIEERSHTRSISDLGGIAKQAPYFAFFFAITMLASVGLPGTSGFIGEFLIILGAVKFNVLVGVLAGTTLIIGVCYMLWMFQRVFFENVKDKSNGFKDISFIEGLVMLPVALLIIFMGIYPQPFLNKITPSAVSHIEKVKAVPKVTQHINIEKEITFNR